VSIAASQREEEASQPAGLIAESLRGATIDAIYRGNDAGVLVDVELTSDH